MTHQESVAKRQISKHAAKITRSKMVEASQKKSSRSCKEACKDCLVKVATAARFPPMPLGHSRIDLAHWFTAYGWHIGLPYLHTASADRIRLNHRFTASAYQYDGNMRPTD